VEGAVLVPAPDLLAAAKFELDAFARQGHREADAEDAAWAMERELHRRGHAHGRVDFAVEPERVVFTVAEGPRVFLGNVSVEGLERYPRAQALARFAFEGAGALGTGAPLFRLSQLQEAAEELEHDFLEAGFYRVEVGDPQVTFRDEGTRADVVVAVREGLLYRVVAVKGDVPADLDLRLADRPYHVRVAAQAAARVRAHWLERGHQFVQVDARVERDDGTGEATVVVSADPGPQVRLGSVRIEGNRRTKEGFLRRRVPIEEGEVIRQQALEEAVDDLYRTRLFSAVGRTVEPVGGDLADLRLEFQELESRSVDFEVGYGSYELARGAVRYRDDNLFGAGRRFEVEGRASLKSYGGEVKFEDPWIFGSRTTLEVVGGAGERDEPSFERVTFGAGVGVRHRIEGSPWTLRGGYKFRAEEARNVTGAIPPAEEEGFLRTAGLYASVLHDTRDDPLAPLRGSLARASVLWSSPSLGADLDFFEVDLAGSLYVPLVESRRTVLALGARFTTREILDDRTTLPIQERLFLGGASSVRSFRQDQLGPSTAPGGEPLGGLTSAEAFVELRRHLWRDLHVALFYDVGMVDPGSFSFVGPPGQAVGAGLRYLLPVGPVRVDVAYNPGELFASTVRWVVHVAIGFSF
jgi:outer membrane protein assembly complex protein YaeT